MPLGHLIFSGVSRSLRAKVSLGIVVPLVFILGAFTIIEYSRQQEAVFSHLSFLASQIGQVIENGIQHEMLTRNPQGLQHMLNAIGQDQVIRLLYLLDTSGRVVFAPEGTGVGIQLDNRDPTCQPCHQLPISERPGSVVVTLPGGERVFRSMNPIENQLECQGCHNPSQHLNGLLLTDISMAPLEQPLKTDLRENLLWWGGTILVTVFIANLAMSRLVIRRLERVVKTLEKFGRGHLDLRLPAEGPDQIGQLAAAFNDMGQRILSEGDKNRELSDNLRHQLVRQQDLLKRLITAQEDERKRVARELHDELGSTLTGLSLHSEAMGRFITSDPDKALEQLYITQDLIGKTTQQMYELILALRPAVLDYLGLASALRSLAEKVLLGNGITFELDSSGLTDRLPPSIEITLYRIFQEALSNVVRHSGANHVKITLYQHNSMFEGEIVDNGRGFDSANFGQDANSPRGLGLLGMQERIAQCEGSVDIISKIGEGTRIRVNVSLADRDCE